MRKRSPKNLRVSQEVARELSVIIRGLKDPRIGLMTSVMDAEVAPDLKTCKVYISVLGSEEEQQETMRGLKSAEGFIRRELARGAESPQHAGTDLCPGPVHRAGDPHVEAD